MVTMVVYEPAEDTFLLEKTIKDNIKGTILEIGGGSGYLASAAANEPDVTKVTVCDIDKNAVVSMQEHHIPKTTIVWSDLFENIDGQFDVIVCNPPYLPRDKREDGESQQATTGGKHGYEFTIRLLQEVQHYLKPDGYILINISSQSKPKIIDDYLKKNLWSKKVAAEKLMFFEKLSVYNITRTALRKKIEALVPDAAYIAKGKRSFVFKGTYKGKECALKVPTSQHYIPHEEAEWLNEVNAFHIGPTLYKEEKDFIIMEWIDGQRIIAYLDSINDREKQKKVFMETLNKMRILDKKGITKEEMHSPLKHIIVQNNKPRLIDFERCHKGEQPKNVTQFVQFLLSNAIKKRSVTIETNRNKVIPLLQQYKETYQEEAFNRLKKSLFE